MEFLTSHTYTTIKVEFQYDVLLIFSDQNYTKQKEIKSFLQMHDIKVCTLDSNEGVTIHEELELYIQKSKLILFYCSEELKDDKLLTSVIQNIIILWLESNANGGHLISLISNPAAEMHCLYSTNRIFMDNPYWKNNLLHEIQRERRETILSYSSNRVKSICQLSGNTFKNVILESNEGSEYINYDLQGVKFTPQSQNTPESPILEIDVKYFYQNLKQHSEGTVRNICDIFKTLHAQEVRLKLVPDIESTIEYGELVYSLLADLFMCVCPVQELIELWLMSQQEGNRSVEIYSVQLNIVDGPLTQDIENVMYRINRSIGKRDSEQIQKCKERNKDFKLLNDKLSDIDKRKQTFGDNWDEFINPSKDCMAESGFYLNRYGKIVCYYCGHMVERSFLNANLWGGVLDELEETVQKSLLDVCKHKQPSQSQLIEKLPKSYEDLLERQTSFDPVKSDYVKRFGDDSETIISALASGGFYNANMNDCVLCYACVRIFCIIGIRKSSIWPLHAGLSPKCPHVLHVKGKDYVEEIQSSRQAASGISSVTYFLKRSDKDRVWQQNAFKY